MEIKTSQACNVNIYMAGDYQVAKQICREYCFTHGCCVTVTATQYIYSAGEESGIIVGLINYPRFPKTPRELEVIAEELALELRKKLCQDSYTIEVIDSPTTDTTWRSWRNERDNK